MVCYPQHGHKPGDNPEQILHKVLLNWDLQFPQVWNWPSLDSGLKLGGLRRLWTSLECQQLCQG